MKNRRIQRARSARPVGAVSGLTLLATVVALMGFLPGGAGERYHLSAGQLASAAGVIPGGSAVAFVVEGTDASADPDRKEVSAQMFLGCIRISTASGADFGCASVPPAGNWVDPLLRYATMSFTVPSSVNGGGTLTATVLLSGTGDIRPGDPFAYSVDPSGPSASVAGTGALERDAAATGTITSTTLGGGALAGGTGEMGEGVALTAVAP